MYKFFGLLFLWLGLSGCSSLVFTEREFLNHPAMDLRQSQTPQVGSPLTQLNQFKQSASSGGCSTCAH